MVGRLEDWRRIGTRYARCPKVFRSAIAFAAAGIPWQGGLGLDSLEPC